VQAGLGLAKQLFVVGCGRGVDRTGDGAGVGVGRAEACEGLGVWLGTAVRAVVAEAPEAPARVAVPVGLDATEATALVGWGGAGVEGGEDPVSVIAAVPAAVITATAATRTAIQGQSPHSAFRLVPVNLPPEASLPAFILQELAGDSSGSRLTNGGWRSSAC
jgi:hypothetical protein